MKRPFDVPARMSTAGMLRRTFLGCLLGSIMISGIKEGFRREVEIISIADSLFSVRKDLERVRNIDRKLSLSKICECLGGQILYRPLRD